MKKIQITILFAAIVLFGRGASAQSGQNEWKLISVIPEDSIRYAQFLFTDPLHGYLLATKPYHPPFLSYKDFRLYRTVDGGYSWQKIDLSTVFGADTQMYDRTYSNSNDEYETSMLVSSPNTIIFSNASGLQFGHDTLKFYWSENSGDSWERFQTQPVTSRRQYEICGIPHDHQVIALDVRDYDGYNAGKFRFSQTNGISFDQTRWDSTLLKNLSAGGFEVQFGVVNNHRLDYFDDSTWIIIVADSNNADGTGLVDTTRPYSQVTLLTRDAGRSWQAYRNIIPHFLSSNMATPPTIQCVRNTPYVYLFDDDFYGEGGDVYSTDKQKGFPHGINFLYSSNYGMTWEENTSFGTNRRGYEPVGTNDVWCTVTSHDSVNQTTPAHWIVHSTNNGTTWNIDSSSLSNDGYYDGRIVSFSGKNNGWIYAQREDRKDMAIFKYIAAAGVANNISSPQGENIFVSPNPGNGIEKISYDLSAPSVVTIGIFNPLGQQLRSFTYEKEEGGNHEHEFDISGLSSGSYYFRLQMDGKSVVKGFELVK